MTIPTIGSKEWSAIADLHAAGDILRKIKARKDAADVAKNDADKVVQNTRLRRGAAQAQLAADSTSNADSLLPALNALIQAEEDILEAEAAQYRAGTAREAEYKAYNEAYGEVDRILKETYRTAQVIAAERYTAANRTINGDLEG